MSLESKQMDRYHILHLLGSGGMSDIYLAEDPRIGQQVAVKVIHRERAPYPDEDSPKNAMRLFQREAKAIVKLDHPHILPLYDYGEELISNMPVIYLVMPFRPEGSLSDWLRRRETKELLSPQDVAYIISQATDALQHAHDHHVIHQDVKPSNFLVRNRKDAPNHPDLLLSDFGIAYLSSVTSSVSQSVRGTPSYMAPEQWEGEPVPATDQYALAVMAYELLTGKLPFQGGPSNMMYQHIHVQPKPPSEINPALPTDIDAVVTRALAKHPQERFASMEAFGNAFQQAVKEQAQIEVGSLPDQVEIVQDPVTPDTHEEAATSTPTLLDTAIQAEGSDSETFVKPENASTIPRASAVITLTQQAFDNSSSREHQLEQRLVVDKTPVQPRKRNRKPFVLVAMALLMMAVVSGGMVYALLALTGKAATGQHGSTGPGTSTAGSSPAIGGATSASITIVPDLKTVQNTFSIETVTGTPNTSQHQYQGARFLSTTTSTYTQTAQATGQGTIQGTHASGTVCIDNFDTTAPITLVAGSVYDNTKIPPFFHMVLDATETVPPAPSNTTWSQRCGPAHVLEVGTIGNNGFNNNQGGTLNYSVFNNPAFNNGKDPQNYVAVQQSDIDNAANALINANSPNAQQSLQPQLRSNEQFINAPQCSPKVSSNHRAGDNAPSVTVSVSFTCSGEVYEADGARTMAAQLLTQQARTGPGSGYSLVGAITTTVTGATITNALQGTLTIMVSAQGKWIYQFTPAQKQALAKLIAGKKKDEAQSILLVQTGIAQVTIKLSGGDGATLPTDASKITINVNNATG